MTDATELDEAAVRAAVEQADGTQWTEEWWRCHASGYFQAAMGGAPDLVSYFNTITPTTMRRLLTALDEARQGYREIHEDWFEQCRLTDRFAARAEAAESALAAVKALADEIHAEARRHCADGADVYETTTLDRVARRLDAALATPTTTEGGKG